MTPDRDTLARDLLTLPALVGAPGWVVRGLCLVHPSGTRMVVRGPCLVHPSGTRMVVDGLFEPGLWDTSDGGTWSPAVLADLGWRVDLDAQATAGVLVDLLHLEWGCVAVWSNPDGDWYVARDPLMCAAVDAEVYTASTLAEAAARALVEVGRVE